MTHTHTRPITDRQHRDALTIWHYHQLNHEVQPCDAAIGLGSHDLGVPVHAAHLYQAGLFPTIVFTGAVNPTRPDHFPRGEAVHFREHAIATGIPDEAILVEPHATNTGQNITLSRQALQDAGITVRTVMLIAMPYMQRRAYATCRKLWPDVTVICASAPVTFDAYTTTIGDERMVTDMLVGDLQRVIEYPHLGYAIEQDVPEAVHDAYTRLVADGFDSRLIS
ncbi:YdcF family protein [Dactylosporangium sp. NPDC005555]|uniref:YdcF family protein n=1 Tax=Dactylosporangium sp. NPDC005555 TaxID=3154889 RepID=UPI0033BDE8B5